MDDELNEILSEEGAGLTTYRAIIRVLVKMWQTAREEIRSAARAADRLRPAAAAAVVLAALSLAGCLYLGSVVHCTRPGYNDHGHSGGGYSRHDAKEQMMEQLQEMMESASTEKKRQAIHRCMDQMGRE